MNVTEDPLRVTADLRPSGHDRLAEEAYARNRAVDLVARSASPNPRPAAVVSTCSLVAGAAASSLALG